MSQQNIFNELIDKLINSNDNPEITYENFCGAAFQGLSEEEQDNFWKYLIEYLKNEEIDLSHYGVREDDMSNKSVFYYINEKADLDNIVNDLIEKYYTSDKLDKNENLDNSTLNGTNSESEYYWNESVSKLISYCLQHLFPDSIKKIEGNDPTDKQISSGDTGGAIPMGVNSNGTKVSFRIQDIINGNAGNSFDKDGKWVRPWFNIDLETYKEVRDEDSISSTLQSSKNLQFTRKPYFYINNGDENIEQKIKTWAEKAIEKNLESISITDEEYEEILKIKIQWFKDNFDNYLKQLIDSDFSSAKINEIEDASGILVSTILDIAGIIITYAFPDLDGDGVLSQNDASLIEQYYADYGTGKETSLTSKQEQLLLDGGGIANKQSGNALYASQVLSFIESEYPNTPEGWYLYSTENNKMYIPKKIINGQDVFEKWIRLIMPMYQRHFEVEDLDRNFWVVAQILSGISSYLFSEDSPLIKALKGLLNEILQLWQNVLFLWIAAAALSQRKEYTDIQTIFMPITNDEIQSYIKFDNFDNDSTFINEQTKRQTLEKCWNRLKYLKDQYSESNLVVVPEIRFNNYKHNYYNTVIYPGVIFYNRNSNKVAYTIFSEVKGSKYIYFPDINDNGIVDKEDANNVLSYYAQIQTESPENLTKKQIELLNYASGGATIDAIYSSYILQFIAACENNEYSNTPDGWKRFCDTIESLDPYCYTSYSHSTKIDLSDVNDRITRRISGFRKYNNHYQSVQNFQASLLGTRQQCNGGYYFAADRTIPTIKAEYEDGIIKIKDFTLAFYDVSRELFIQNNSNTLALWQNDNFSEKDSTTSLNEIFPDIADITASSIQIEKGYYLGECNSYLTEVLEKIDLGSSYEFVGIDITDQYEEGAYNPEAYEYEETMKKKLEEKAVELENGTGKILIFKYFIKSQGDENGKNKSNLFEVCKYLGIIKKFRDGTVDMHYFNLAPKWKGITIDPYWQDQADCIYPAVTSVPGVPISKYLGYLADSGKYTNNSNKTVAGRYTDENNVGLMYLPTNPNPNDIRIYLSHSNNSYVDSVTSGIYNGTILCNANNETFSFDEAGKINSKEFYLTVIDRAFTLTTPENRYVCSYKYKIVDGEISGEFIGGKQLINKLNGNTAYWSYTKENMKEYGVESPEGFYSLNFDFRSLPKNVGGEIE